MGRKNESECRACDPERDDQTGQCQKSGRSDQDLDMVPDFVINYPMENFSHQKMTTRSFQRQKEEKE